MWLCRYFRCERERVCVWKTERDRAACYGYHTSGASGRRERAREREGERVDYTFNMVTKKINK